MLSVVHTSMPAASNSSMSCQRLGWRLPGTLVWAYSSTSSRLGRRASAASRIELLHDLVAVDDRLARQNLEAFDQLLGLAPAVGLDQARHDIAPARFLGAGGGQHGVGLADAGRGAEKNLQMPAALLLGEGQQGVGRSSLRFGRRPFGGNLRLQLVEREVELEHVDARLAQQAEGAALDLAFHQGADALLRQAARLGDPRHLETAPLPARCPDRGRCRTSSPDRPGPPPTGSLS